MIRILSAENLIKIDIIILISFSKRNEKKNIKNKKNFTCYIYNKENYITKNCHFRNKIRRKKFEMIIIKNILNKINEKNII